MKVGDKVIVTDHNCSHCFEIGEIVTLLEVERDGIHLFIGDTGRTGYMNPERYKKTINHKIQLGGKYTSKNGYKSECIAIKDDTAWLATDCGDSLGAAYRFNLDGEPIFLGMPNSCYKIVFPPVIETREADVKIEGETVRVEYEMRDGVLEYGSVHSVLPF